VLELALTLTLALEPALTLMLAPVPAVALALVLALAQRERGRSRCPRSKALKVHERLAHSLVLSLEVLEEEFSRVATSLAEATSKLAEARTKLREAADEATWRRFFGRHYISAAELKNLQQAALEKKAQVEVDGRERDVLAARGKCVALESDVAAALRVALLIRVIRDGNPTVAHPDDPHALRVRCDQMARATEEPSKLESEESTESSEAEASEAESSEDFGPSAVVAAAEEEKGDLSPEPELESVPFPDQGLDADCLARTSPRPGAGRARDGRSDDECGGDDGGGGEGWHVGGGGGTGGGGGGCGGTGGAARIAGVDRERTRKWWRRWRWWWRQRRRGTPAWRTRRERGDGSRCVQWCIANVV
jgi:hypothetical protein